jgi:hypothetical protein
MKSNTEKAAAYFEEAKLLNTLFDKEEMISFAAYVLEKEKDIPIKDRWSELNATLLVNFLRMPDEHKRHLIASIFERRPDVFPDREEDLNKFFVWFRDNGEHFIGMSVEQLVKTYMDGLGF